MSSVVPIPVFSSLKVRGKFIRKAAFGAQAAS
jgi:hypothetical protein